jgi:CHAD domain-containing protein
MSLTSYRAAPPRDNLWKSRGRPRPAFLRLSIKPGRDWKGLRARFFAETVSGKPSQTIMGDKPALRPRAPVGAALIAVAQDILAEARAALDNPAETDAVHDYRKAMKRWRAYLRLLEPLIGAEADRLRGEARDLARRLAGTRDIQAMLDALADVEKADPPLSKTSLATMRRRIEEAPRTQATATLTPALRVELRAALARAGQAITAWPLDGADFADIAAALGRHYRRARRALPAAWDDVEAEALHQLRQRVVAHRYQMELVEPLWPRLGKLWVAEAQRLRERLGAHQDLVVLERLTAPHQLLARWRSRLQPLIEQRKAAHIAAANRLAGRLFAERPRAFRRRLVALWER